MPLGRSLRRRLARAAAAAAMTAVAASPARAQQVELSGPESVDATAIAPQFTGALAARFPAPGTRGPSSGTPAVLELSAEPDAEFVAAPTLRSPRPLYGQLRLGKGGRMHFVLDESSPGSGRYDLLVIDKDQDRDLQNDGEPVRGAWLRVEERGRDYTEFTDVTLDLYYGHGAREPFAFTLYVWYPESGPPDRALVVASSWREGSVDLEEGKARVAVHDADADGLFDRETSRWALVEEGADPRNAEWQSCQTPIRFAGRPYLIRELSGDGGRVELSFATEAAAFDAALAADPTLTEPPRPRADKPLAWADSLPAALATAQQRGQRVFVLAGVPWSRLATQFEERTLQDAEVARLLEEYACAKLDPERDPETAKRYGVVGTPTILVLSPEGEVLERQVGYRSARSFAVTLRRLRG